MINQIEKYENLSKILEKIAFSRIVWEKVFNVLGLNSIELLTLFLLRIVAMLAQARFRSYYDTDIMIFEFFDFF